MSVCIPAFNPQPAFFAALLDSVAAQRVEDLEVVIVDDASEAAVAPLVRPWTESLSPVLHANRVNLGMVENWNETVRRSTGELVMLVCQDDVLSPGMIERYVEEFEVDPDVVLCSGGEVFIDASGAPIGRRAGITQRSRIYRRRERYELDRTEMVKLCLRNGQAYGEPSTVMFRRTVFDRIGGYRSSYEHAPDIDFNLRAVNHGIAVYLTEPYLHRRIHADNLTWGHIASGASSRDRLKLHEEYGPTIDPFRVRRSRVTLVSFAIHDAVRALRWRRWEVARANLRTAWRYKVNTPRYYLEHLWEILTKSNLDER